MYEYRCVYVCVSVYVSVRVYVFVCMRVCVCRNDKKIKTTTSTILYEY